MFRAKRYRLDGGGREEGGGVGDFKLRSVRLLTDDSGVLFRFYRDGLGLAPQAGGEGGGYARFVDGDGGVVEVFPDDYPQSLSKNGGAIDRAALCFETDDVHEAVHALCEQGAGMVTEPVDVVPLGVRVAQVRDPAGNLIVLRQKLA